MAYEITCATSSRIFDIMHTFIVTPPFAAPHLETGGVFAFYGLDKYNPYGIMETS